MEPEQAAKVTGDGYVMVTTLMHEICHGLGPAFARTAAGKLDIRECHRPASAPPGRGQSRRYRHVCAAMAGRSWCASEERSSQEYYASYVADLFRTVRFGIGRGSRAGRNDGDSIICWSARADSRPHGRYAIDYEKMPGAMADLTKELLETEATGDRQRAETGSKVRSDTRRLKNRSRPRRMCRWISIQYSRSRKE